MVRYYRREDQRKRCRRSSDTPRIEDCRCGDSAESRWTHSTAEDYLKAAESRCPKDTWVHIAALAGLLADSNDKYDVRYGVLSLDESAAIHYLVSAPVATED